jgi:hypothetical protein
MGAVRWNLKCKEDKEGSKQETDAGTFSILGVQIQEPVSFLKRLLITKLQSNKTTPNGLGRMGCSVLRIS